MHRFSTGDFEPRITVVSGVNLLSPPKFVHSLVKDYSPILSALVASYVTLFAIAMVAGFNLIRRRLLLKVAFREPLLVKLWRNAQIA